MRRVTLILGVLLCALAIPTSAIGARPPAAAVANAGHQVRGQATGTITALGGSWFTIQTSGRRIGVINALIAAANAVRRGNYSYVWGGGHEEAGVPTRAGRKLGYDCSGSVAAVLAGAGLWAPGSGVPNDAGVIAQLMGEHLIARGAGTAPTEVTLYDHPGVHIFMNIDGRFFGTSDGGGGGSPKGGPGWLYDGAWDAYNRAFKQYHIVPSVLRDKTTYGHTLTFQTNDWSLLQAFALGDRVQVNYTSRGSGIMVAPSLTWAGAVTTAGEVSSVSADGSTFSILTPRGRSLSFSSGSALQATGELALGE